MTKLFYITVSFCFLTQSQCCKKSSTHWKMFDLFFFNFDSSFYILSYREIIDGSFFQSQQFFATLISKELKCPWVSRFTFTREAIQKNCEIHEKGVVSLVVCQNKYSKNCGILNCWFFGIHHIFYDKIKTRGIQH